MQEQSRQISGSALRHAAITVIGGYLGVRAARYGIDLPPESAEQIVTVGLALGGGIGAALGAGVRWAIQRLG